MKVKIVVREVITGIFNRAESSSEIIEEEIIDVDYGNETIMWWLLMVCPATVEEDWGIASGSNSLSTMPIRVNDSMERDDQGEFRVFYSVHIEIWRSDVNRAEVIALTELPVVNF